MATAPATKKKTTTSDGPLIGVRRVAVERGDDEYIGYRRTRRRLGHRVADDVCLPKGTEYWTFTRAIEDFRLDDATLIPAATPEECEAALLARFPGPCPELPRVEVRGGWRYDAGRQVRKIKGYFVHARPLATAWHDLDTLAAWAAAHGPLLVADASLAHNTAGFADSGLVVGDAGSPDYALLKFAPSKAAAGAKARATRAAKARAAEDLARAAAQLRGAVDALAQAVRDDLIGRADWLYTVLTTKEDSHDPDDHEPRDYRRGKYYGRRSGRCYGAESHPGTRDCMRRLIAFVAIHARFAGRRAYRRLDAWDRLRDAYRTRPKALEADRWGLTIAGAVWLDDEMKARKPRPRPAPAAPVTGNLEEDNEDEDDADGRPRRCRHE